MRLHPIDIRDRTGNVTRSNDTPMSKFTWLFLAMVSAVVVTAQAVFVYLSVKHDLINNRAIAFSAFSGLVFFVLAYICVRRGFASRSENSAHNQMPS